MHATQKESVYYLHHLSLFWYGELGVTPTNVLVGVISVLIDKIPLMFAILAMHPEISEGQWLLATLTVEVGCLFNGVA